MSTATRPPGAGPRAWDSSPTPARLVPRVFTTLAVLALVPSLLATALRVLGPTQDQLALLASFASYGLLGYLVALVFLLVALVRARRRSVLAVLVGLVVLLTALHVSWLAPSFVANDRPTAGPSFRVMSLNVYKGAADLGGVTAQAETADVVVLLETTTAFLEGLETDAFRTRFPYAVGALDGPPGDTTVYSRYPLSGQQSLGPTAFQQWVVTVAVPGRAPVRLIASHPCNPYCPGGRFATDQALLRAVADANMVYPLVVAGDLNATDDHGPMQQLRRDGLRSAADLAGAGWMPTWPANRRFPPLLGIDHVFVDDQLTVTAVHRFRVNDTDHLGLMATVVGVA